MTHLTLVALLVSLICNDMSTSAYAYDSFALVSDQISDVIRKIDLVTLNVTSVTSSCGCSGFMPDVRVSCDGSFAVYLCNYAVMKLVISTGVSSVLAGNKNSPAYTDHATGTTARFDITSGLAMSSDCNYVLVADTGNCVIRKVMLSGAVSTVAGNGVAAETDALALSSSFSAPSRLAFHPKDNYVLVIDGRAIRKVTFNAPSTTSTIAGDNTQMFNMIDAFGTGATFFNPYDLAISSDGGYALVTEYLYKKVIRKVDLTTFQVTTIFSLAAASIPGSIRAISFLPFETNAIFTIYSDIENPAMVWKFSASDNTSRILAGATLPGVLNGVGTDARFVSPVAVSVWSSCPNGYYRNGNTACTSCAACIAGTSYETAACTPTTNRQCTACTTCVLGTTYELSACTITTNRTCAPLTVDCSLGFYNNTLSVGSGTCIACAACPAGYARSNCSGKSPGECILGSNTFALVADSGSKYIRKIDLATADVKTVGAAASYAIQSVVVSCDGTYAIYTCGSGLVKLNLTSGIATVFAGNLAIAGISEGIGISAKFSGPQRLRMSKDCKYILVAESTNRVIRKVVLDTADVSRIAGSFLIAAGRQDGDALTSIFYSPFGIAISPDESYILVLDSNRIRKVTLKGYWATTTVAGDISTPVGVAGSTDGVGTFARFNAPREIDFSPDGSFALIADVTNNMIRKFDTATGMVSTLISFVSSYGSTMAIAPRGLCFGATDEYFLFTTTKATYNMVLRASTQTGELTVLAGTSGAAVASVNGVGTAAKFSNPSGISTWECNMAGYFLRDNVCRPCSACQSGHYLRKQCTDVSEDSCAPCTDVCPFGSYLTGPCTVLADTVCTPNSDCPIGMYNSGGSAVSDGTCIACAACAAGYTRANCTWYFAGTCIRGADSFALVSDQDNDVIRKVNLVTSDVTSLGSSYGCSLSIPDVSVSCDGLFAVYICGFAVMKLTLSTGASTVLAGNKATAGIVNHATGTLARFQTMYSLEMSKDCTYVLVGDYGNHVIRKVILSGTVGVSTIAGNGLISAIDGAAMSSSFSTIGKLAFHPKDNYVLLIDFNVIRKLTLTAPSTTSTIAGNFAFSIMIDAIGADAGFMNPVDLTISPDGSFALVTEYLNYESIRKIDLATNEVTTIFSLIQTPIATWIYAITFHPYEFYALFTTISSTNSTIWRFSPLDNQVKLLAGSTVQGLVNGKGTSAQFKSPVAVSVWSSCPYGYFRTGNTACIACTKCTSGTNYESTACTPTTNRACTACTATACSAGSYKQYACNVTNNRVCSPCTACVNGVNYEGIACSSTVNRVCSPCTACVNGVNYEGIACSSTVNRVCYACSSCSLGSTYAKNACNTTRDTVCSACTNCATGTKYTTLACNLTSDMACAPCSSCPSGSNQVQVCSGTNDTVCSSCSACPDGKYQSQACTGTMETQCSTCSSCIDGMYQSQVCNATSDTTCAPCELCTSNGYYKQGCSGTSAGRCVSCSNTV